MLFSAPDEVARTNAITWASEVDQRLGQVRAHEAVGAGDEAGAAGVALARAPPSDGRVRRPTRWLYRRRARMEGNRSRGRGAVRSGLQTGLSTAAVSGSAAVLGVILSRKFGHGVKTDGFFAAYGVYLALVLVAGSLRVVVLPRFVAARSAGRLGRRGRDLGGRACAAARRRARAGGRVAARDRQRADLERERARSGGVAAAVDRPVGRRPDLRRPRRERARRARRLPVGGFRLRAGLGRRRAADARARRPRRRRVRLGARPERRASSLAIPLVPLLARRGFGRPDSPRVRPAARARRRGRPARRAAGPLSRRLPVRVGARDRPRRRRSPTRI